MATQTWSKHASQWPDRVAPSFIQSGKGAHVWDVDGNEWLDYAMALAPVILGYAEPAVNAAVRRQLEEGVVFSLSHPIEVQVAEQIVRMVPGVEAVRFGKSGSDVVSAAVRAARNLTGRDQLLVCGWHGWHDWYVASAGFSAGVPTAVRDLVSKFAYNDLDSLEQQLERGNGRIAAVALEPSGTELPTPGFLEGVVERAHAHGALVIFDEVVTGFRLAPGGARERYGVQPDFSCYGKALGNGMPVSAVAGRWDVMRSFDEVFVSLTHGGETLSLAAASVVLDMIADGSILARIERLGTRLLHGFNERIAAHGVGHLVRASGEPHRPVVTFPGDTDQLRRSWVHQCFAQHGILFNGSTPLCARHTDADIDAGLVALDHALEVMARCDDLAPMLVGAPMRPVFRSR
jgi:glutamate-1-semialdehyde aminotransferase